MSIFSGLNGYSSPFDYFEDRRKVAEGSIVHKSLVFRDAATENWNSSVFMALSRIPRKVMRLADEDDKLWEISALTTVGYTSD